MEAKEKIAEILHQSFTIRYLDIQDHTAEHAHHPEMRKSEGGHFAILIVAADFQGKTLIERHRMVYKTLEREFQSSLHALALKALTPAECEREDLILDKEN